MSESHNLTQVINSNVVFTVWKFFLLFYYKYEIFSSDDEWNGTKDSIYQWLSIRTKKIILCVSQIDYRSKWPSFARNLYRTGSCGEKLNWMNQLLCYFLCQGDKLLRAFLENISLRLKPLTLFQQAANFISSVSRRHLEGSTLKS